MSAPALRIRPYDERDEDAVVALWGKAMPAPAPRNEPRYVIRQKLEVQRDLFFVADRDGDIVGTAMGGYDGRRGWIYAVAVLPELQRQGIGAAVVRHVEHALVARGCAKVNLQIEGDNADVVSFYEKLGFRVEDRISMGKVLIDENAPR